MIAAFHFMLQPARWPTLAILASLAMLAAAHAFEIFARLDPCPLCLRQREVYWAAIAMAVTGLGLMYTRPTPRFGIALSVMLGLVFVTGAVVAAYHAGVEWHFWSGPAGCSGTLGVDIGTLDLDKALDQPQATGSCGEAPWRMLGLSMAGWNVLVSLGLAGASFMAAFRGSSPWAAPSVT